MPGEQIVNKARKAGLDPGLLYEAVIDLATDDLLTASSINRAAGILLNDLVLPGYFLKTISKSALRKLLKAIALSMRKDENGEIRLYGRVAPIDFESDDEPGIQRVRIVTRETRDAMEHLLETQIPGHRRAYYFSPDIGYATYLFRPETVEDFAEADFKESRFLFNVAGDYATTPEHARARYEDFLKKIKGQARIVIQTQKVTKSGETRIMFNSDFERPQLPVLRKMLEDFGCTLTRTYWEPYLAKTKDMVFSSICAIYVMGDLPADKEQAILAALRAFLSFSVKSIADLYVQGELSFEETLFAGNAMDFCRLFIYQETDQHFNEEILGILSSDEQRDTFGKRLLGADRAIYTPVLLEETVRNNSDLIKMLYAVFAARFDPKVARRPSDAEIQEKKKELEQISAARFIDAPLGGDIIRFMFKLITSVRKTNFYKADKRSFSFRCDNDILDPLVYRQAVHGVFFVNGHYASGTHLRAADIARGGLRMLRVTRNNHQSLLNNAVLLNYALGAVAQRLKHKDICESGAKGVIVPHPQYAHHTTEALIDYTEGILDLVLPSDEVVDHLGVPELIFFGPDEGTAPLMNLVADNARQRDYRYWRTLTTGKTIGIPHDTFGILESGEVFGLFDLEEEGVELQIEGKRELLTKDMHAIEERIGGKIRTSGMTTTSIKSCFRALIAHAGEKEENLNLMITGGPGGDLGANEIQGYRGKICGILDSGSVLFDPDGLDKAALRELAYSRHTRPRANSTRFPLEKLGKNGFRVLVGTKNITLPGGRVIADGTLFHHTFLTDPANRPLIEQANIRAFIPCGGLKDTINYDNVARFAGLFKELRFIVEGANVFFDDASRRYLAQNTDILQIKDFTSNKGGVFSSSVAEVLPSFLLQDRYEEVLLQDQPTRWGLVRDILNMVEKYARLETELLIRWYEQDKSQPIFVLAKQASEQIFAFQDELARRLPEVLASQELVDQVLALYIPPVLWQKLGRDFIVSTLGTPELVAYRNAILTKKIASMAFYRFGLEWQAYLQEAENNLIPTLLKAVE